MSKKGQQKIFDEFAWIIFIAVGFVLIVTIIFAATTPSPVLEPKSVQFTLTKGESHTFTVTVRSADEGKISNVTMTSFGEIKDWITFDKINFDLENSTTVRARIKVPTTASLKSYTGGVKAESKGGSSSTSVLITVSNVSLIPLESRVVGLIPSGSIDVKYETGDETIFTRDNIAVTKGAFSSSKDAFSVSIPEDKMAVTASAYLDLILLDTNKRGNLIVELNGVKVYDKKTDVGRVVVPIDRSLLNTTNVVGIRTTGPSIFQFWSKASYKIEKANFVLSIVDTSGQERTFELTQKEIQNFHHFQLQSIKFDSEYSSPLGEMIIKINNQIVYGETPPLVSFNQTISKDILGNNIVLDTQNTISFFFVKESFYRISNPLLVVFFS